MAHIKTRNNLIEFLEDHLPPNSVHLRALLNYNENLGGFSQVFSLGCPGWIVKVTSKNDNMYYIAVINRRLGYLTTLLYKDVPWRYWIGGQSTNPLYCGYKPEEYKMLREKELKNEATRSSNG